jgi:hypothetical protein
MGKRKLNVVPLFPMTSGESPRRAPTGGSLGASRRIHAMKRRMVAAVALSAVLCFSLETQAGTSPGSRKPAAGLLDRAIAWISKAVHPLSVLLEKEGSQPNPGPTMDGGGCLDPLGGIRACS